jgi:hypothetical protein
VLTKVRRGPAVAPYQFLRNRGRPLRRGGSADRQWCLSDPACSGEGGFKVESVLIRCWLAGPRLAAVLASLLPSPVLDVAVVSDSVGATVDSNL